MAGAILFNKDVSTTVRLTYSDIQRAFRARSPRRFWPAVARTLNSATPPDLLFGSCQAAEELSDQKGDYLSYGICGDASWTIMDRHDCHRDTAASADDGTQYRSAPVASVTSALNALNAAPLNPAGNLLGYSTTGAQHVDDNWDDLEARLALNYLVNDRASAYASVAKGYKAGGFEPATLRNCPSIRPRTGVVRRAGCARRFVGAAASYQAGLQSPTTWMTQIR